MDATATRTVREADLTDCNLVTMMFRVPLIAVAAQAFLLAAAMGPVRSGLRPF